MKRYIAGSLAGVTASSITFPLDLARARMAVTQKAQLVPHSCTNQWWNYLCCSIADYHGYFKKYSELEQQIYLWFVCMDRIRIWYSYRLNALYCVIDTTHCCRYSTRYGQQRECGHCTVVMSPRCSVLYHMQAPVSLHMKPWKNGTQVVLTDISFLVTFVRIIFGH